MCPPRPLCARSSSARLLPELDLNQTKDEVNPVVRERVPIAMSNTLPSSKITPAIPAVVIVVDSSYTLYQEWQHILVAYCTPLFARLAEGHSMPVASCLLRRI